MRTTSCSTVVSGTPASKGYIEVSPGRHVDLLSDDSTVRTDYFTQSQIETLIAKAEEDRRAHPNHFNDWPEFIRIAVNTRLRCQEILFLEFSDIDWSSGVLHVRNKKHLGFSPKSRKERRIPLNDAAITALRAMLTKKYAKTDLVFHLRTARRGSRYWSRFAHF